MKKAKEEQRVDLLPHVRRLVSSFVKKYPNAYLHFEGKSRWLLLTLAASGIAAGEKTYDYFLAELSRMVSNVYNGNLGGAFIDLLANLISGQINQAYNHAWKDAGIEEEPYPEFLQTAAEQMILNQYNYVDGFYRDIVDARIDETPIDPLLARCPLWANRWNEAYNDGLRLIALNYGQKMIWKLGQTEEHCDTCATLNGIVAYSDEWEAVGVRPQNAPNQMLECEGWHCDCSLTPTDQRRSPRALDRIRAAVKTA